jgi:hypothetical protein
MAKTDNKMLMYIIVGFLVIYLLTKNDTPYSPRQMSQYRVKSKKAGYKYQYAKPAPVNFAASTAPMMDAAGNEVTPVINKAPGAPPVALNTAISAPVPSNVKPSAYTMSNPAMMGAAPYRHRY